MNWWVSSSDAVGLLPGSFYRLQMLKVKKYLPSCHEIYYIRWKIRNFFQWWRWLILDSFIQFHVVGCFRIWMMPSCHLIYHYSYAPDITWIGVVFFIIHSLWGPILKWRLHLFRSFRFIEETTYMYKRVPTNVLHIFKVASKSLLMPKSVSLASPNYELTSIFAGFTSLWICFLTSCRYASPFKVY